MPGTDKPPAWVAEALDEFGDRATAEPLERRLYRRDLASVPDFLADLLFDTTPEVVVRPQTVEEVSQVLRFAWEHQVPITPRASASTTFFNAVPSRGGMVLDLTALRGMIEVDKQNRRVTVLPATRWRALDDELGYAHGLRAKSLPTSAPSATVGGWFSMGGLGIGSLKYGSFHDQVRRAQVVYPNGVIADLTPDSAPPLGWLAGAEGTLGVVTQLEMELRPAPEREAHLAFRFQNLAALAQAMSALAHSTPIPYHLHFVDEDFAVLLQRGGYTQIEVPSSPTLGVHYDGDTAEVERGIEEARRLCSTADGTELEPGLAQSWWEQRYTDLRTKRAGSTLLGAESLLPLARVEAFSTRAKRSGRGVGKQVYTYGLVVAPDKCLVNAFYPANEQFTPIYLMELSLTQALHTIGRRLGGTPYGLGAWNTPYFHHAYPAEERSQLIQRKQHLDPKGIMNPGKVYAPPTMLTEPWFGLGMGTLRFLLQAYQWARS